MCEKKPIAIVYGAYINAAVDWRKFIKRQLMDLKKTGILKAAHLYIAVTNPNGASGVHDFLESLDIAIRGITIQDENQYEYPAIKASYDLAYSPNEYTAIAYLHTKGMSYFKGRGRDKVEEVLLEATFSKWEKVLSYFEEMDGVCKAGALPAKDGGFIWYNFWWARPSYLRMLETPIISDNRYYYESWLGGSHPEISHEGKTLSIADWEERFYEQPEAVKMVRTLRVRYRLKFLLRKVFTAFTRVYV